MNKSKFNKFIDGKGFYVALVVCLVGAGVATWAAVKSTLEDVTVLDNTESFTASEEQWDFQNIQNDLKDEESSSAVQDLETYQQQVLEVPSSSESSSQESTATANTEEVQEVLKKQDQSQVLEFVLPMSGDIINDYSNGELVKSKTLKDWRTHDGIDIKATVGSAVHSVEKGVVEDIYNDGLWGTVVEISHPDGHVSIYASLNEATTVKVGDKVAKGDVIGSVGDTAEAEIALDPHLHFAMKKDGEFVDPVLVASKENIIE